MRSALSLRTSIVTAALAGAMLVPAAGAAFAAPAAAPQAVTSTEAAASETTKVVISEHLVALMSNSVADGPSVEIRVVDADGTTHPKPLASLNRSHAQASEQGMVFTLAKADTAEAVLTVWDQHVTKSFPLPKATGPAATCISAVERVDIGEGSVADLTMSPEGPQAVAHSADPSQTWSLTLTRTDPTGRDLRIVNPNGAHPVLEWWHPQGGVHAPVPLGHAGFPALPAGCTPTYKVHDDEPAPKPIPSAATPAAPKPAASAASAATPAAPKPQTGGQTTVVPRGGVAAGAEIAVEDTDDTTTVAAGAGLMAIFGALGAVMVLRRRAQD
ncbi:hypothetical protein ABZY44_10155 [Streptomyces sp. NPDC006544]|uniref:hypothetical protein n=1 Tax=Streptomyces sp. NPDC006544 TaxID=3154583 RepID=UPI0033A0EEA1